MQVRTDVTAGQRSGSRFLAPSVLGLSIALILLATLLPSEPGDEHQWSKVLCVLCGESALADGIANVALFVPLGVALALTGRPPHAAVPLAAMLSMSVELAQFLIPGRDPSLGDFIFNTLGAAVGGQLVHTAHFWISSDARVAGRLSLVAAGMTAIVFILTDVLLTPSFPHVTYFGGSKTVDTSKSPLRIGANTYPREYFRGRIDEVRIYNSARTTAEVQADMDSPVATEPTSPHLVAAYSFDAGSGTVLTDVSGHGNDGQIVGATWTDHGRFGHALAFDGPHNVVVVPHSASLSVGSALTLEAWVYPTSAQNGWRAILQKDVDAYFLDASSDSGPLRPAGGGTFGSSVEHVAAPSAVPLNVWTHLALTYDGSLIQLFVNGRPAAQRFRWYSGSILDASLGGLAISPGASADSGALRDRLLSRATLRVTAVAGLPVPTEVPLVNLHDGRHEIVRLGAAHRDLVFRFRTRAASAELDTPAMRVPAVLRGVAAGDPLGITISRAGRGYCVDVNTRSLCGVGFTLGTGWTLLLYSQVPLGWLSDVLNNLWMAALVFPVGFWVRRRPESVLAGGLLIVGVVLPCTLGSLMISYVELAAGLIGILAGSLTSAGIRRHRPGARVVSAAAR